MYLFEIIKIFDIYYNTRYFEVVCLVLKMLLKILFKILLIIIINNIINNVFNNVFNQLFYKILFIQLSHILSMNAFPLQQLLYNLNEDKYMDPQQLLQTLESKEEKHSIKELVPDNKYPNMIFEVGYADYGIAKI